MAQVTTSRDPREFISASRSKILSSMATGDRIFAFITRACAYGVFVLLLGIMISLIMGAWPAIKTFGLEFLITRRWAPQLDEPILGALAPIYGTLLTSFIAMLIAVPFGLGIAVFLTELCPIPLRRPIRVAVELLAGVPSIIYGMWGFFVLGPFLVHYVEPPIVWAVQDIPVLNIIFGAEMISNISLFNASLVLAIMILPFVTAIAVDVFSIVPPVLKESAYGIGCTTWEVVTNVVVPYARVGLVGGVMLALGRALGETMAVTYIIGNSFKIDGSIFSPGTTISAAIASEFAESSDLHRSALMYLGLILFILTFLVLAAARLMLMRLEKRAGA